MTLRSHLFIDPRLPSKERLTRAIIGGFLLFGMALVVVLTYRSIERELRTTLEQKLTAVLHTNVQATEQWFTEQRSLVARLANEPHWSDSLSHETAPTDVARATPLTLLIKAGVIDGYAVFDERRALRFSSDTTPFLTTELTRALLDEALERGAAARMNRLSNDAAWRGALIAVARIGERSRARGFLVLALDPNHVARDLSVGSWGRSGSTFAFDAEGHLLTSREKQTPPPPALFELTKRAMSQPSEVILDVDSEFLEADRVGAFLWIENHGIGIATEVDRSEAYESVVVLRQAFIVLVVLIGFALLGFLALGRWTLQVRQESVLATQRLGRLARTIQPLSAALEHDPGAVVLIDDSGTVIYANSATRQILGLDGPLIGKPAGELFDRLHAELREAVLSGVEAIVAQKPGRDDETLLVTSRPLRIEGKPHIMYTLRPVTREVRRQEVDHWKKLIRVLSHELNNSLAPIASLVSSARTLNDLHFHDPKLTKILDAIAERTSHLVSFLESYRSIARLPRPSPRLVEWEPFIEGLRTQRGFQILGTLPGDPAFFDPIQLERVLINTLDNAAEAGSPAESIAVSVTALEDGVLLEILDRGAGMSEATLRQAMLPFFSTKQSGTGVGLALSREIVEAHGGQMTLANREGGGLVVSILLPLARQPALSERSPGSLSFLSGSSQADC